MSRRRRRSRSARRALPMPTTSLLAKVDTPSWNEIIRGGVFAGLGTWVMRAW